MWPRRQETFPRPDASPPRCAQLMGLASRGCLVLMLGATAERRNLFFRSDLGLPWIRTVGVPPIQVKQTVKCVGPSVQRAARRPSPIPVRAHVRPHRQHRRRYRPTSTSRSRRVWPLFMWRSWTPGSSSPKTGAQRRHPWRSRGWSAKPEGAQPADTRRGGEVRQPTSSGVSRHWLTAWSATRPRATLARMSSAVAVHTNGLGSVLCAAR